MKIAIIRAGNVGGTLGKRWAKAGHEVPFGARDPADARVAALVRESGARTRAASVPEAVRGAEVVAQGLSLSVSGRLHGFLSILRRDSRQCSRPVVSLAEPVACVMGLSLKTSMKQLQG
jgi:predicted dinucleotide-binding enzyme